MAKSGFNFSVPGSSTTSGATTSATTAATGFPSTGSFSFGASAAASSANKGKVDVVAEMSNSLANSVVTLNGPAVYLLNENLQQALIIEKALGFGATSNPSAISSTQTSTLNLAATKLGQTTGFSLGGSQATGQGLTLGASQSTGTVPKTSASVGPSTVAGLGAGSAPAIGLATTSAPAKLSFGATTAVSSAVTTTTTAATSTAASATTSKTPGPTMTYKELEDQMNKWSMELDRQERVFLEQATKVNAWDKVLIENGQKITDLNSDVEKIKLDQHRLTHELDFILAQQKELEEMLVPLEDSVSKLPPINYQQHTDTEREHTYQIAENIDAQLKRMTEDLKEVIDHLNTGGGAQDGTDPMLQISKILNAHMESLQWVDQNAAVLQRKTEEVSRYAEITKKEHERNFRLAYS